MWRMKPVLGEPSHPGRLPHQATCMLDLECHWSSAIAWRRGRHRPVWLDFVGFGLSKVPLLPPLSCCNFGIPMARGLAIWRSGRFNVMLKIKLKLKLTIRSRATFPHTQYWRRGRVCICNHGHEHTADISHWPFCPAAQTGESPIPLPRGTQGATMAAETCIHSTGRSRGLPLGPAGKASTVSLPPTVASDARGAPGKKIKLPLALGRTRGTPHPRTHPVLYT